MRTNLATARTTAAPSGPRRIFSAGRSARTVLMAMMSVDPAIHLSPATLLGMPKSKGRRKPKRVYHEPPPPKEVKVSPTWYIVLMAALMTLGVIIIILNYIDLMPFDDPINWLYVGLLSIAIGMTMLLNFH